VSLYADSGGETDCIQWTMPLVMIYLGRIRVLNKQKKKQRFHLTIQSAPCLHVH